MGQPSQEYSQVSTNSANDASPLPVARAVPMGVVAGNQQHSNRRTGSSLVDPRLASWEVDDTVRDRILRILMQPTAPTVQQTISKYVLTGSLALLVATVMAGIFFAQHCAQVYANQSHHDVTWSPYIASLITTIAAMCPLPLCAMLLNYFLRRPLVERYTQTGVETVGQVVGRYIKQTKTKNGVVTEHRVIYAYRVHGEEQESIYTKIYIVKAEEYQDTQLSLLVLPGIPTSAIRQQDYHEKIQPYKIKQIFVTAVCTVLGPTIWILALLHAKNYLPPQDFWYTTGLPLLLVSSLLGCLGIAYAGAVRNNTNMLNGGAKALPVGLLPPDFFGNLEDPGECQGDTDSAIGGALSLEMV